MYSYHCSRYSSSPPSGQTGKKHTAAIAGGVVGGIIVLALFIILYRWNRSRRASDGHERTSPGFLADPDVSFRGDVRGQDKSPSKEQDLQALSLSNSGVHPASQSGRTLERETDRGAEAGILTRDLEQQPNSVASPPSTSTPLNRPLPPPPTMTQLLGDLASPRNSAQSQTEIIQRLLDRGLPDAAISAALTVLSAEASSSGSGVGSSDSAKLPTLQAAPTPRVTSPMSDISAPPEYDFKGSGSRP